MTIVDMIIAAVAMFVFGGVPFIIMGSFLVYNVKLFRYLKKNKPRSLKKARFALVRGRYGLSRNTWFVYVFDDRDTEDKMVFEYKRRIKTSFILFFVYLLASAIFLFTMAHFGLIEVL